MDLDAIAEGWKEVLEAAVTDWHIESYVPDAPNPPAILIGAPDELVFRGTLSGRMQLQLPLILVAGVGDIRSSYKLLRQALSTTAGSVLAVVHGAEHTAWVGEARVLSVTEIGRAQSVGGTQLLAAFINTQFIA